MTAVVILMLAAAAGFGVSRATRMPLIPLLVVAGFAVARGGLSLTADALEDALSLGLTFLIFSMGVELNPARFRRFRAAVMWTGALQFLVVGACGFALAVWLGFGSLPALYLAISVTTSSTLVVIRQLQRQTGAFGTYGKLVTGVLLVQDLALIMVLVVISRLPEGPSAIASGMGVVAGMAGAAFAIQRWVTPILAPRFRPGEETLLLSILAVLFLFAGAARAGGLPLVTGAFFAGFSLSAFPVSGVVRSVLGSLNTWFLALFFTALGARLEIPGLSTLAKAIAFALLVLAVTPPLVAAVAEWKGGLSSRNAIISGLFLAQTSEMGVVLGLYGVHLEAVPGEVLSIVALTAVITMTLTPLLAKDSVARRLLPLHPFAGASRQRANWRDTRWSSARAPPGSGW